LQEVRAKPSELWMKGLISSDEDILKYRAAAHGSRWKKLKTHFAL